MDVIAIGPLMLKWELLMLIISVLAGYVVVDILLRMSAIKERKLILDDIATTLLFSILIWKCSAILFEFNAIIHQPMLILYYTGGTYGWILSVVFAFSMLVYKTCKQGQRLSFYASPALTWTIAASGVHAILILITQGVEGYSVGIGVLSVVMIFVQYRYSTSKRVEEEHTQHFYIMLLSYSLGLFALSLLDIHSDPLWIGLTTRQLLLIVLIGLALRLKIWGEKKQQNH